MSNVSVYLPDAEEEWAERNIDNLSKYVQERIRNDMKAGERVKVINNLNKRLGLIQMLSFLFLGMMLICTSTLMWFGTNIIVIQMMIGFCGIWAVFYALLSFKIKGGSINGINNTNVVP